MTLLSDLATIAARHSNQHPDAMVPVPIGALRAALIMLRRYEAFPLLDRKSRPEWMFNRVDIRGLKGRGRKKAERLK